MRKRRNPRRVWVVAVWRMKRPNPGRNRVRGCSGGASDASGRADPHRERAGGHLEPDGDGLVVEAPEQLLEPIMTELRALKAEVLVALASQSARASSGNDAWLTERGAMREVGSGTTRVDADKLVFDELLWVWHAANPVALAPGQCAACGTAFEPPVMSLPDGAQVCDKADHGCLISYGNGRRMEAVGALGSLGIKPPTWWEL